MTKSIKVNLNNEKKTKQIAELIAKYSMQMACENLVIFLNGNLGAGKTTFSQFFIKACGYRDKVKSPTYTLIENYNLNNKSIYHLDLYRLTAPEELSFLGFEEIISQNNIIVLIEWPEKGEGFLPTPDITINLELQNTKRTVEILFDHNKDGLNYLWQDLKHL